jgi:hypothetical protein
MTTHNGPDISDEARLRYHLDAIKATPAMRQLLWQIWRAAGFEHAMATVLAWRGQ